MNGFTKLDNSILFNNAISAQAKILYAQFFHYSTIPNFVIRKSTIMKASGMKKNTFEKYMRELKVFGLIGLKEKRVGNKYEYEYIVNETPVETTDKPLTKAKALVTKVINELKQSKSKQQADVRITKQSISTNKFHNFEQRQYTKRDYNSLEQMLLQKSYGLT